LVARSLQPLSEPNSDALPLVDGLFAVNDVVAIPRLDAGFDVVWAADIDGGKSAIRGQEFTASGDPAGEISDLSGDASQTNIGVSGARASDGSLMLIWSTSTSEEPDDDWRTLLCAFDSKLQPIWDAQVMHRDDQAGYTPSYPSILLLDEETAVAAWEEVPHAAAMTFTYSPEPSLGLLEDLQEKLAVDRYPYVAPFGGGLFMVLWNGPADQPLAALVDKSWEPASSSPTAVFAGPDGLTSGWLGASLFSHAVAASLGNGRVVVVWTVMRNAEDPAQGSYQNGGYVLASVAP